MSVNFAIKPGSAKHKKGFLDRFKKEEPLVQVYEFSIASFLEFMDNKFDIFYDSPYDGLELEDYLEEALGYNVLVLGAEEISPRGFEFNFSEPNQWYHIRVNTPASEEDWLLALNFMHDFATKMEAHIEDEDGEIYTAESILQFPYKNDISYGLQALCQSLREEQSEFLMIRGVHRPCCLSLTMLDGVMEADKPMDAFSELLDEIVFYPVPNGMQMFMIEEQIIKVGTTRNQVLKEGESIEEIANEKSLVGYYVLNADTDVVLPLEPCVEAKNLDLVDEYGEVAYWMLYINPSFGEQESTKGVFVPYEIAIKSIPEKFIVPIDANQVAIKGMNGEDLINLLEVCDVNHKK